MEGLILAAGMGSRLASVAPVKPLAIVNGQSLLAHAVARLGGAGVRRVVVVTGHGADAVEAQLPMLAAQAGLSIEAARLADWSRPNGWSVLAGAERIAGDYLLVMADHMFSPGILPLLANVPIGGRGAVLAVDHRLDNPLIDPADATYVRTSKAGRIVTIGKGLAMPDAVDCGAFRATPMLAQAISAAIGAGRPGSLSDGMQWLADRGLAGTVDIGARCWIDVDDPRALLQAEGQAAALCGCEAAHCEALVPLAAGGRQAA